MARNYYVWRDADEGGDGLTPATAWKRTSKAADKVKPGDSVYIGPGVYDDPLEPAVAGFIGAGRINWIGDPMGEYLNVPAGPVRIPYYAPRAGADASENVIWFIDFYDARPAYGGSGGYSVTLTNGIEPGPDGDPYNISTYGQMRATYFISCKLSHGVNCSPRIPLDQPGVFGITVAFRSCVLGYNFSAGFTTAHTVRLFNQTHATGGQQDAGTVHLYGCTVLAAPDLSSAQGMVAVFNNQDTTMSPVPPWEANTAEYLSGVVAVNTIFDMTPCDGQDPPIYGFSQPGVTPSFAPRIRGNYNIYRQTVAQSCPFSSNHADLATWQAASIEELGDMAFYIDTADDKLKFKFTTDPEEDGAGAVTGGGTATVTHSSALSADTWYHVAATWDRTTQEIRINVDGSETVTGLEGSFLHRSVMSAYGGCYYLDRSLHGKIDEYRLWGAARTAGEIAATKDAEIDPGSYPDLLRYYTAGEGSGTSVIDQVGTVNGLLSGVSYDPDVPPSFAGYSLLFTTDSYVRQGAGAFVTYDDVTGNDAGSFTIEMWVKIETLASTLTHNILLFSRGTEMQDSESQEMDENDDLFAADGYHLTAGSPAIDTGTPLWENGTWAYSGPFDIDGDQRPTDSENALLGVYDDALVDIGCDEYVAARDPDTSTPYGFTSHIYPSTAQGFYPSKFMANLNYSADLSPEGTEACDGTVAGVGGWQDHIRVLITFNPASPGKWIEIVNTMTGVDLRGEETPIPNSLRGPHFRVAFEIYPHAQHLKKFDLGMSLEEASTESINEDTLGERGDRVDLPPGCEVIAYNEMFKERVGSAIVAADHSFSIPVWPGTYYLRFQGPQIAVQNPPRYVTVGFSDWYAPFGQTQCGVPVQVDFAEFANTFSGVVWSSWFANEQFIDEAKRVDTEIPDEWPNETYAKKALVRCGRLLKASTYVENFEIYTDPQLDVNPKTITTYSRLNLIVPWPA